MFSSLIFPDVIACCQMKNCRQKMENYFKPPEPLMLNESISQSWKRFSQKFEEGKEKILEQIKQKIKDHCDPQRNYLREPSLIIIQPFDNYLTELRKAVKTTDYPNQDEMIRVRIVIGLRDGLGKKS